MYIKQRMMKVEEILRHCQNAIAHINREAVKKDPNKSKRHLELVTKEYRKNAKEEKLRILDKLELCHFVPMFFATDQTFSLITNGVRVGITKRNCETDKHNLDMAVYNCAKRL